MQNDFGELVVEIRSSIKATLTETAHYIPSYKAGEKHNFSGKRIKRGMYKSAKGLLINADLNGSYNILRKVVPNAFTEGIEGLAVVPFRFTPGKVKLQTCLHFYKLCTVAILP